MSDLPRVLACLCCLGLAIVGGVANRAHFATFFQDAVALPRSLQFYAEQPRRERAMQEYRQRFNESVLAKTGIAEELIAGRIGFANAMAQFLQILSHDPAALQVMLAGEEGDSVDEKLANHVVGWACAVAQEQGSLKAAEAVKARLDRQLQDYFIQSASGNHAGAPDRHAKAESSPPTKRISAGQELLHAQGAK